MNKRIRELRKELNLSGEKFGERLGVGKTAVSRIENGSNNVTDQMFKSICREFNVNEEWLRNGNGDMFSEPDTFNLDEFIKSKGATAFELEIIKTYFELDPGIRRTAMEHFKRRLAASVAEDPSLLAPDTEEELEAQCPPVDASGKDAG